MKFSGKNFQPWPDFDLDISGLTIVIGPSDEGKSSIYRALKGILRNDIDVAHIRNPKDESLNLKIEYEGHVIEATRSKKGSVKYNVDGLEYAKLAGDVPDKIRELKFGEIKLGDFTFDPIFASQNRSQFLIDNESFKPTEINAILGAFGGTEKLEFGKKQANLQKTQKDSEARLLAAQIREAEDRKSRLEIISNDSHQISDLLYISETAIGKLEFETHWLAELIVCIRRLEPIQQIIKSLILPDTTGLEQFQQIINHSKQAAFSDKFVHWMSKPLRAIADTEEVWRETARLWGQIKSIEESTQVISVVYNPGELSKFHTDVSMSDLNNLLLSIIYLEGVSELQKELKKTVIELIEIDEQLSTTQSKLALGQKALHDADIDAERTRMKGLCSRCGKSLEHVCE